ncbi:MAG: hypothetical protein ACERKJ_11125 [Candidatus Dadabacteria bacterium]
MTQELTNVKRILKKNRKQLLARKNVVAVGVGYKETKRVKTEELSIVVSVVEKVPNGMLSIKDRVPRFIGNVITDVIEKGVIKSLGTERLRPAQPGCSIGHHLITAGTFGFVAKHKGERVIVSNNHVLANSNNAELKDSILQPGSYDGGRFPDDLIGTLGGFVPIKFVGEESPSECSVANVVSKVLNAIAVMLGRKTRLVPKVRALGENLVDAAFAYPITDGDISDEIISIGSPNGIVEPELGMAVMKHGRTTNYTQGIIEQVDVTVNVQYGEELIAIFTDQFMTGGAMSAGGDSGSAVLDGRNNLVGLLFAGSEQTTIYNRIQNVFSTLDISI